MNNILLTFLPILNSLIQSGYYFQCDLKGNKILNVKTVDLLKFYCSLFLSFVKTSSFFFKYSIEVYGWYCESHSNPIERDALKGEKNSFRINLLVCCNVEAMGFISSQLWWHRTNLLAYLIFYCQHDNEKFWENKIASPSEWLAIRWNSFECIDHKETAFRWLLRTSMHALNVCHKMK